MLMSCVAGKLSTVNLTVTMIGSHLGRGMTGLLAGKSTQTVYLCPGVLTGPGAFHVATSGWPAAPWRGSYVAGARFMFSTSGRYCCRKGLVNVELNKKQRLADYLPTSSLWRRWSVPQSYT